MRFCTTDEKTNDRANQANTYISGHCVEFQYSGLTGQRPIAWSKEQSACQHQWQQIWGPFKVGAQCKQRGAQNTQEGEQEDANCREGRQRIHLAWVADDEVVVSWDYTKARLTSWWDDKHLYHDKHHTWGHTHEIGVNLQRFPNLSIRNPAMITTTAFLIGEEEKKIWLKVKGWRPINCHKPKPLKFCSAVIWPLPW